MNLSVNCKRTRIGQKARAVYAIIVLNNSLVVSPVDMVVIVKYSVVSIDTAYKKLNLRYSRSLSK